MTKVVHDIINSLGRLRWILILLAVSMVLNSFTLWRLVNTVDSLMTAHEVAGLTVGELLALKVRADTPAGGMSWRPFRPMQAAEAR